MKRIIALAKTFLAVSLLVILSTVPHATAHADTNGLIPLDISPICSDASTGLAYFQALNKNDSNQNIQWTNIDNGVTGNYNAAPGKDIFTTNFVSTDPNNTTQFIAAGNTTQTNATQAACAPGQGMATPPAVDCIDGTIQQNLQVVYTNQNTVSIHTTNDDPLCADVVVNLTSYIMPSNYDGGPYAGNMTAYPQTSFATTTDTLHQGTDGTDTISVALPDSCNNTQIDLYYGAVQNNLGANGSGPQNILSQVYRSTGTCTPTGGMGGGSGSGSTGGNGGTGSNGGGTSGGSTGSTGGSSGGTTTTTPVVGGMGGGDISTIATTPLVTIPAVAASNSASPTLADTGDSRIVPYTAAAILSVFTLAFAIVARKQTV